MAAQEIGRHGNTDEEYMKGASIKISEHLFVDFKNEWNDAENQSDASPCEDRTIKMEENIRKE